MLKTIFKCSKCHLGFKESKPVFLQPDYDLQKITLSFSYERHRERLFIAPYLVIQWISVNRDSDEGDFWLIWDLNLKTIYYITVNEYIHIKGIFA